MTDTTHSTQQTMAPSLRPPNMVHHATQCPSSLHLLFAHGAGAGSQHPFMQAMAQALTQLGVNVWLFDFAYMAQARAENKRRPPPRFPQLEAEYLQAVQFVTTQIGSGSLWIGGKSMGGRVACHALNTQPDAQLHDAASIAGAVVIGYPFHPTGKPESQRLAILQTATAPILICQGERDSLGSRDEIAQYEYPDNVNIEYFTDGDHSLKPRKKSGFTEAQHIQSAAQAIANFIKGTEANVPKN